MFKESKRNEDCMIIKPVGGTRTTVPLVLFDVIMEDGCLIRDCRVKTKKGYARDLKDFRNAMRFDQSIMVVNKGKALKVFTKDVYEAEVV